MLQVLVENLVNFFQHLLRQERHVASSFDLGSPRISSFVVIAPPLRVLEIFDLLDIADKILPLFFQRYLTVATSDDGAVDFANRVPFETFAIKMVLEDALSSEDGIADKINDELKLIQISV